MLPLIPSGLQLQRILQKHTCLRVNSTYLVLHQILLGLAIGRRQLLLLGPLLVLLSLRRVLHDEIKLLLCSLLDLSFHNHQRRLQSQLLSRRLLRTLTDHNNGLTQRLD